MIETGPKLTALYSLSAEEMGHRLRRRELSPLELVQAHLERIQALNPRLVAFLYVDGERALAAARLAESEIARNEYRGPLHGLPIAYKDIVDVQGLPTTAASRVLAENVASTDATLVAKLRQAGAICLGKLNTTEFASGDMAVTGEARNPWDTSRTTGGSSSGPAGAVAARLSPLAVGTDTGGSVRIPASFCGIVGLRPTYGRISQRGIIPLSWTHDQAGPMARSVTDLALLLAGMAGPGVGDATAQPVAVPDYRSTLADGVRGVRLGVPRTFFLDQSTPEIRQGTQAALATLTDLGATVLEVDLPQVEFGHAAQWAIAYSESYVLHRRGFLERSREYGARFFHKIAGGAFLSAEELVVAHRLRHLIGAGFSQALEEVDAIIVPTTGYPAPRVGEPYPGGDQAVFTRPISLVGLPALSVPCGLTAEGLPMGLQIIGRPWEESLLLRIAYAYEQAAGTAGLAPEIREGSPNQEPPVAVQTSGPSRYGRDWVLQTARMNGLSFVEESDAEPIASSIAPIKELLAQAQQEIQYIVEPWIPYSHGAHVAD